jgi:1,4-dihydroxy-6-naphthoate synthase
VRTRVVPFDRILDEVREGRADVGLIIHEGQLTYGGRASTGARPRATGGSARPACRCRWAATPCAATWARADARAHRLVRDTVRYSLAHRQEALATR